MAFFAATATEKDSAELQQSKQYQQGKFRNGVSHATASMSWSQGWDTLKRYILEKRIDATPKLPIPVQPLSQAELLDQQSLGPALYRLGHSSLLLSFPTEFWLIDPVFGERASPFKWFGPKRFHQVPIQADELPQIRGVIISHDHYDHLDQSTITQLKDKVESFVVPLGVGKHLRKWGVADAQIIELDWWQSQRVGTLELTATPAQHFSGRWLTDGNQTLWASWVIESLNHKVFFSGDSGYFDGFKQIGERFGPFDLSIMENGAYDANWSSIHMAPEESLKAHLDVKAKAMLPVHNSTFDLALHPWYEPLNRLEQLSQQHQVQLLTPVIGQRLSLEQPVAAKRWWQKLENQQGVLRTASVR